MTCPLESTWISRFCVQRLPCWLKKVKAGHFPLTSLEELIEVVIGILPGSAIAFTRIKCQRRIGPFEPERADIVHNFVRLVDVHNLLELKADLDRDGEFQQALSVGLPLSLEHLGSIDPNLELEIPAGQLPV